MIDYDILCLYVMLRTVCTKTMSFILWQGSTACLISNDYFSSDCFARSTAEHVRLRYFIYQLTYPHSMRCHTFSL